MLDNTEISEEAKEIAKWINTGKPKFNGVDLKFHFSNTRNHSSNVLISDLATGLKENRTDLPNLYYFSCA